MNASLGLSPGSPDICRRLQTPGGSYQFQVASNVNFLEKRRLRINVRGFLFETFQATLEQFPETMLGCPRRRFQFYDPVKDLYFLDRDPAVFDSILFFYQSNGILARPENIPKTVFNEELRFFDITGHTVQEECEPESSTAIRKVCPEEHSERTCPQLNRKLRKKCWLVMEQPRLSIAGKIWGRISITVILLSVFAFCLETLPEFNCVKGVTTNKTNESYRIIKSLTEGHLRNSSIVLFETANLGFPITLEYSCLPARIWFIVETTLVVFFLVEYLVRIYSSPNRCGFIISVLGIVDLASIVPYFVTLAVYGRRTNMYQQVTSFSVLRIIRLLRVLRVFKLSRYSNGLKLVGKTFSHTWRTLFSLMTCVLMAVLVSSSFLFYAEDNESIPAYFYWAFVTMTTVGYGDVVPTTIVGKIAASACMFFGIVLLFILPLPVFVTHFSSLYEDEVDKRKKGRRKAFNQTPRILEQLMKPAVLKKSF